MDVETTNQKDDYEKRGHTFRNPGKPNPTHKERKEHKTIPLKKRDNK